MPAPRWERERERIMESKHTPGPWSVDPEGEHAVGFQSDEAGELLGYAYREADAKLIAAAPLLLEALFSVLAIVEDEYADDPEPEDLTSWKRAIEDANAAIKAATE